MQYYIKQLTELYKLGKRMKKLGWYLEEPLTDMGVPEYEQILLKRQYAGMFQYHQALKERLKLMRNDDHCSSLIDAIDGVTNATYDSIA